jgi:hypothetical protein
MEMGYTTNLKKFIASAVIIAIIFHGSIFLRSQEKDEIVNQFDKAIEAYSSGQYDSSKVRLEGIIDIIKAKRQEEKKKNILGKCYLLLGAVYEKKGETILAEENYRRAKKEYGVEFIDGVAWDGLPIHRRVIYIDMPFQDAVDEYNNKRYDNSKSMIEKIIDFILRKFQEEDKDVLGKCYLLLGAVYEKKGEKCLAEKNYCKGERYGITTVDGVGLGSLKIFKRVVNGIIEKEKECGRKKKFPWLLVAGGAAVVVAIILLIIDGGPPPTPKFVTSTDSLNVPEGGTAAFDVRLSTKPSSNVSVSVTRVSGDTDINVQSGSSLTFTTSNWSQNQTVTLAANEDVDTANGSAAIRISATGMQNKDLTAAEQDNDVLRFVTDKDTIYISEGRTNTFTVMLSNQPAADLQTSVTRVSGDTDISVVSGGSLTFTTSNWNTYQIVTLRAAEDADTTNGQAVIRISAAGIQDKDITAVENDRGCNISISITSPSNNETVSGTVTIQAAVTGNCVVDRVEFYIDSVLKGTDSSEPYSYDWDTTTAFVGPHVLRVVAYSTTGKSNNSQITVTVTR